MNLRTAALAGVCVAFVFTGSIASAATIVTTTGTPLPLHIHNVKGGSDSTALTLETKPGGFIVDYTSSSMLHDNGSSGGFAEVTGVGPGGGPGFLDLTIDPESPLIGFTAIKFKLEIPGDMLTGDDIPPSYKTDFFFDTMVNFVGGGSETLLNTLSEGDHRFLVSREGSEVIESIKFFNLHSISTKKNQDDILNTWNFHAIKQVSINGLIPCAGGQCEPPPPPGIPEPETWGLMILGFGAAGALLRRRVSALG